MADSLIARAFKTTSPRGSGLLPTAKRGSEEELAGSLTSPRQRSGSMMSTGSGRKGRHTLLPARRSNNSEDMLSSPDMSPRMLPSDSATDCLSPSIPKRKSFFSSWSSVSTESSVRMSGSTESDPQQLKAMQKVDELLAGSEARNALVAFLLAEHRMDLVLKARFMTAIHELMRSDPVVDRDWTSRARHIVKVFLSPKSKFHMEDGVPAALVSELRSCGSATSFEAALTRARSFVSAEFAKDELIRTHLGLTSSQSTST